MIEMELGGGGGGSFDGVREEGMGCLGSFGGSCRISGLHEHGVLVRLETSWRRLWEWNEAFLSLMRVYVLR